MASRHRRQLRLDPAFLLLLSRASRPVVVVQAFVRQSPAARARAKQLLAEEKTQRSCSGSSRAWQDARGERRRASVRDGGPAEAELQVRTRSKFKPCANSLDESLAARRRGGRGAPPHADVAAAHDDAAPALQQHARAGLQRVRETDSPHSSPLTNCSSRGDMACTGSSTRGPAQDAVRAAHTLLAAARAAATRSAGAAAPAIAAAGPPRGGAASRALPPKRRPPDVAATTHIAHCQRRRQHPTDSHRAAATGAGPHSVAAPVHPARAPTVIP